MLRAVEPEDKGERKSICRLSRMVQNMAVLSVSCQNNGQAKATLPFRNSPITLQLISNTRFPSALSR
jgi:hypothetical protein